MIGKAAFYIARKTKKKSPSKKKKDSPLADMDGVNINRN